MARAITAPQRLLSVASLSCSHPLHDLGAITRPPRGPRGSCHARTPLIGSLSFGLETGTCSRLRRIKLFDGAVMGVVGGKPA